MSGTFESSVGAREGARPTADRRTIAVSSESAISQSMPRSQGPVIAAALVCTLAGLAGCTANRYGDASLAGIGSADPALELLAAQAASGDRQAQLELGIRFEEGAGVPRDLDAAQSWYRRAARGARRPSQVYVPSVGRNGRARIAFVGGGPASRPGLREARQRLARLRELRRSECR